MNKKFLIIPVVMVIVIFAISQGNNSEKKDQTVFHVTLADPDQYVQDIADEHKVFGCDLWVEVSGVSEAQEGPTT